MILLRRACLGQLLLGVPVPPSPIGASAPREPPKTRLRSSACTSLHVQLLLAPYGDAGIAWTSDLQTSGAV